MTEDRITLALAFATMAYATAAAAVTSLQQLHELAAEGIPISATLIAATEHNINENLRASITHNSAAISAMAGGL